jgi:hypothetical protein
MNSSRSQRRTYEKYLKSTNKEEYKKWKEESISRGQQLHLQNLEEKRIKLEQQLSELNK